MAKRTTSVQGQLSDLCNLEIPLTGDQINVKENNKAFKVSFPLQRIVQLRGNNATSENVAHILCFTAQKVHFYNLTEDKKSIVTALWRDFFNLFIWAFVWTLYPVSDAIALLVMTKCRLWWTFTLYIKGKVLREWIKIIQTITNINVNNVTRGVRHCVLWTLLWACFFN